MNTNGMPRLEADAIHLQDENNGDNGWAAVVNVLHNDYPGSLIIGRERYASEAEARLAALDLLERERRRIEYVYKEV